MPNTPGMVPPDANGCSNRTRDGKETDTDCGGPDCKKCVPGDQCRFGGDCTSQVCSATGVCEVPTCVDGIKNGDEAGPDCGGACPRCGPGQPCGSLLDCTTNVCQSGVCRIATCG